MRRSSALLLSCLALTVSAPGLRAQTAAPVPHLPTPADVAPAPAEVAPAPAGVAVAPADAGCGHKACSLCDKVKSLGGHLKGLFHSKHAHGHHEKVCAPTPKVTVVVPKPEVVFRHVPAAPAAFAAPPAPAAMVVPQVSYAMQPVTTMQMVPTVSYALAPAAAPAMCAPPMCAPGGFGCPPAGSPDLDAKLLKALAAVKDAVGSDLRPASAGLSNGAAKEDPDARVRRLEAQIERDLERLLKQLNENTAEIGRLRDGTRMTEQKVADLLKKMRESRTYDDLRRSLEQ